MEKERRFLKVWIVDYLRAKDAIKKDILDISEHDSEIDVTFRSKKRKYLPMPHVPDDLLVDNHVSIVTFNTRKNFAWLLGKWHKLSSYDDLSIIFINPFSTLESKWIIFPYSHNRISDKESLVLGLKSLYATVSEMSEGELKSI